MTSKAIHCWRETGNEVEVSTLGGTGAVDRTVIRRAMRSSGRISLPSALGQAPPEPTRAAGPMRRSRMSGCAQGERRTAIRRPVAPVPPRSAIPIPDPPMRPSTLRSPPTGGCHRPARCGSLARPCHRAQGPGLRTSGVQPLGFDKRGTESHAGQRAVRDIRRILTTASYLRSSRHGRSVGRLRRCVPFG